MWVVFNNMFRKKTCVFTAYFDRRLALITPFCIHASWLPALLSPVENKNYVESDEDAASAGTLSRWKEKRSCERICHLALGCEVETGSCSPSDICMVFLELF